MSFSAKDRDRNLQRLKTEFYDLVVIGGGINGAGVARDAASRGMKVAVIEADDFASGTSSRSSKLIHGGIRYLENLEFGLVFEALRERRNLFEMAPHLVHPLRFMLPIYTGARIGMFRLGLGMWLYDALSLFETPQMHERLDRDETLARASMLNADGLLGSFVYSDAYMDDDRLVIETMRSAHSQGVAAANFVKATGSVLEGGQLVAIHCLDQFTASSFTIRAKHFVSTVGPWTDIFAGSVFQDWRPTLRPTKGIHLTFSRQRLPLEAAVVMVSNDQKRIIFGIPRHEMVIVGTTDTDFEGDPSKVQSTEGDVEYLLHVINQYFPGSELQEADIISSYSGVRPLVNDGSSFESKTSREHAILKDPRNITFLIGGKYTTYRSMAEQTVNTVLENFSIEEQLAWARSMTKSPLNAKATDLGIRKTLALAPHLSRKYNIPIEVIRELAHRHGEETLDILRLYLPKVRAKDALFWCLEAYHAIHETMCLKLKDFYLRRVHLFLAEPDHGRRFRNEIANVFASELGWSEGETKSQIQELDSHESFEMAWRK